MHVAMGIALAVGLCGCAAPSALAPRVPVNAQLEDPTTMRAPDIIDGFPHIFHMSEARARSADTSRSISLGFIGDARLGTQPTPPHREPDWARPFPCHWTGTCWMVPPLYVRPYFDGYAVPPPIPPRVDENARLP